MVEKLAINHRITPKLLYGHLSKSVNYSFVLCAHGGQSGVGYYAKKILDIQGIQKAWCQSEAVII